MENKNQIISTHLEIAHKVLNLEYSPDEVRSCQSCRKANVCAFYSLFCSGVDQFIKLAAMSYTDIPQVGISIHKRMSYLTWVMAGLLCDFYEGDY